MNDIKQRITDVLDAHLCKFHGGCECGKDPDSNIWNEHAAAVLVSELGLLKEERSCGDGFGGQTIHPDGSVTVEMRSPTYMVRYVTPWERVSSL